MNETCGNVGAHNVYTASLLEVFTKDIQRGVNAYKFPLFKFIGATPEEFSDIYIAIKTLSWLNNDPNWEDVQDECNVSEDEMVELVLNKALLKGN